MRCQRTKLQGAGPNAGTYHDNAEGRGSTLPSSSLYEASYFFGTDLEPSTLSQVPYASVPNGGSKLRLYYESLGSGEPLILLMGQGQDHRHWYGTHTDLAARHQVIVFDQRGTGESDKPEDKPYSTRDLATDTVWVLNHLGIERAHAYGFSMGGRVCQWMALDHPDRLGSLVLSGTTPGSTFGVRRGPTVDSMFQLLSTNQEHATALLLNKFLSPAWMSTHPDVLDAIGEVLSRKVSLPSQRLHYLASEAHNTWELLPKIAAPTLVIHGGSDEVNPPGNAILLAHQIPGAKLEIIPHGRHWIHLEYRATVSKMILDFLQSTGLPNPT